MATSGGGGMYGDEGTQPGSYGGQAGGQYGGQAPAQPGGGYGQQPYGGGPGYGWGGRMGGMGMRGRQHPIETKPFFLTSEFVVYVIMVIALIITTLVNDEIDAPQMWAYLTALTFGYMLARGIAKSGTKSRSLDPREQMLERRSGEGGGGGA